MWCWMYGRNIFDQGEKGSNFTLFPDAYRCRCKYERIAYVVLNPYRSSAILTIGQRPSEIQKPENGYKRGFAEPMKNSSAPSTTLFQP